MKRRDFLVTACAPLAVVAAAPFVACARKTDLPLPPGELLGMDLARGHRLRARDFPPPGETRRVPVLIVGAGIGGLSAAWRLQRAGMRDFLLLDLEAEAGGNSRWGENAVSAYPWGGHYLPLPPRETRWVRELLADLGAIEGDPQALRPRYDERRLCHTPQERVYADGFWQDGLIPRLGASRGELDEIARFGERMAELKMARDAQGRRAFALPAILSSPDPRWRMLDRLTMRQWLVDNGFSSLRLHGYVDYACRDDFGTGYAETSAWAGLHYFACRNGEAANAAGDAVLTAPEGNGWIVRELVRRLGPALLPGAVAWRLAQHRRGVSVDVWLAAENRSVRFQAEQAIWAAPLFALGRVADGLPAPLQALAASDGHAPWLVANLTLDALPAPGAGVPLAWDNVLFGAAGLGYVVATHQRIALRPGATVLTYYRALSGMAPAAARDLLLTRSREAWAAEILTELGRAHADLPGLTRRLDVFRHAHAMIRPLPGVVHDARRQAAALRGWGRVRFAHADFSGMSLFEEANANGVHAAEQALAALGVVSAA